MMMRSIVSALVSAGVLLALAGCASLAPDYQRPAAPVPAAWGAEGLLAGQGKPLAEVAWREYFADARLVKLIDLALQNNRDLRVAALNIERARAQYQIASASAYPAVNATAGESVQKPADVLAAGGQGHVARQYNLGIGVTAYELDFFGRVRNLREQALEQFLATEDARRSAQLSLVAEVANIWLTLAADQERLRLARDTHASQGESLALVQRSYDLGAASALDLNQARMTLEAARADVARYTNAAMQDRNALALLLGAQPPADMLPEGLDVAVTLADIPAGLSSEMLLTRPDVAQAERLLRAAHANIGAARAAFYPRIALTGSAGLASDRLSGLFESGTGTWSFVPQIVLPIFNAGSNRANLDAAKVDRDIRIAQYEKSIQSAFREVADALAVRANIGEQLAAQEALVRVTGESYRLSELRFRKGVDSYLAVLDSQRALYGAQQNLVTARVQRLSNFVAFYKALGGGALVAND